MGACHKTEKPPNPIGKTTSSSNSKLNLNIGSKGTIPILQQPQLNDLIMNGNMSNPFHIGSIRIIYSMFKNLNKDWSKLDSIDKILDKILSFHLNTYIRKSNSKAYEISKNIKFKNSIEAASTILQIMKKNIEISLTLINNENNDEITYKITEIVNNIQLNLLDNFKVFINYRMHTLFFEENYIELIAKLLQIYHMMMFYKNLKIKEIFFHDQSDSEFLQKTKEFITNFVEKLRNFLNKDVQWKANDTIEKEMQDNYLKNLKDNIIEKVYNDVKKKGSGLKNLDYYLNDCDIDENKEEESFKKPLDSFLLTGTRRINHKAKFLRKV